MELIVRNYGKFLLEAIIFVTFWMLVLGNMQGQEGESAISHIWEAIVSDEPHEYGADFAQCVTESERHSPQILCRYEGVPSVGSYNVGDIFEAFDCMGDEVSVEARNVYKVSGEEVNQGSYTEKGKIYFHESGIYRVQLYAVDQWNNESVCDIYIPVC